MLQYSTKSEYVTVLNGDRVGGADRDILYTVQCAVIKKKERKTERKKERGREKQKIYISNRTDSTPSSSSKHLPAHTLLHGWALRSFPFGTFCSFPFFLKNVPFFSVLFSSFW